MKPQIAVPFIILILLSLACSALTVDVNIETTCEIVEGFEQAPDNTHEVYLGETLFATLEYKNGTFTIYDSGHNAVDNKPVSPTGFLEGTVTAEYADVETTKEVDFVICGGILYIRERESGRNPLDEA